MLPEKSEESPKNNSENEQTQKWKHLFWCYLMSLLLLFIGFAWLIEIRTKGYYVDGKHQIAIYGDSGLITVYALIIGGFVMLAYSIYSTLKGTGKKLNIWKG